MMKKKRKRKEEEEERMTVREGVHSVAEKARARAQDAVQFVRARRTEAGVLLLLTLLSTGATLLLRFSRGVRHETYSACVAVLAIELIKGAVSAVMVVRTRRTGETAGDALRGVLRGSLPSALPALLYCVQNALAHVALRCLDAGVYSVLVQVRLLTTGLFSVLFLGRRLTLQHWRALVVLLAAVLLVEQPPCPVCPPAGAATVTGTAAAVGAAGTGAAGTGAGCERTGVAVVLVMACTSSFAGVYWEKVLKDAQRSAWERNLQLSLYSIVFAIAGTIVTRPGDLRPQSLVAGISPVALLLFCTQAAQGLVTAFVTKLTSTIIRNYSATASLCLTALLSVVLFGAHLGTLFWVGLVLVIISIDLYREASALQAAAAAASVPAPVPAPVRTADTDTQQTKDDKKEDTTGARARRALQEEDTENSDEGGSPAQDGTQDVVAVVIDTQTGQQQQQLPKQDTKES